VIDDDDFDGFEWDEAKNAAIFAERGISLEAAARMTTANSDTA